MEAAGSSWDEERLLLALCSSLEEERSTGGRVVHWHIYAEGQVVVFGRRSAC